MKGGWLALIPLAAIAVSVLISACTTNQEQPPMENKSGECSSDADCAKAGCSGQLCVPEGSASGTITTCEYKEEYDCRKLTSCGCAQGRCAWAATSEYELCMDSIKNK